MVQNLSPEAIEFAKIIDEMFDLYVKKNANYGNSFSDTWKDFGIVSGCTRLSDKMNRIKSLVQGGKNNFESLQDTFIDMANYAIMCVIEMRKDAGEVSSSPTSKKQILNESDYPEQLKIEIDE